MKLGRRLMKLGRSFGEATGRSYKKILEGVLVKSKRTFGEAKGRSYGEAIGRSYGEVIGRSIKNL